MLLAIDTSAGTSVAVVDRDAGVLAERATADTRSHAEVIGRFIAESLAEAGVSVAQLTGVVAGVGPGPFTGLRVGIAAARTFAFGAGTALLPVISHDAIALGRERPTLITTDARRREVYWSRYDSADQFGLPVRLAGPELIKPDDLETPEGFERLDATTVSAASLGLLAELMLEHGRSFAEPEAVYLRSPDVTISAGPKRVTS